MQYRVFLYSTALPPGSVFARQFGEVVRSTSSQERQKLAEDCCMRPFNMQAVGEKIEQITQGRCKATEQHLFKGPLHTDAPVGYLRVESSYEDAVVMMARVMAVAAENGLAFILPFCMKCIHIFTRDTLWKKITCPHKCGYSF